ncbi:hypothetical protein ABN028_19500 [Actinopolymorpha sp. B17G11]|uniref:hypothetical protein n=1 Tax=Actinopolymorpha sp. B17G11 TaxID=3160861 RepID=UPI0032E50C3B
MTATAAIRWRRRTSATRVVLWCARNHAEPRVSANVWQAAPGRWHIRLFFDGEPATVDTGSRHLREARDIAARVLTRDDLTTAGRVITATIDARLAHNAHRTRTAA